MELKKIKLLWAVLFLPFLFFGQEKPKKIQHKHSDKIQRIPGMYNGNLLWSGDVIFEHNGATLKADSVIFYDAENQFKAFSNVHFLMDGQTLDTDDLIYDGNTQIAVATGNVVLREKDQTLYTNKLEYNRNTNLAYYNTGGTIISADNTITSTIGVYNATTKSNSFSEDVNIINKDYIIEGRNVEYFSDGDYMVFKEQSLIRNRENYSQYIVTDNGKYYLNRKEAFLESRSTIYSDDKSITGDKIVYNQLSGYGKAQGNVILDDPLENRRITGGYAEVFQEMDSAYITQDAIAIKAFKDDSLYLHADTLLVTKKNDVNQIRAYYGAKIYKSNIQGKADSIAYNEHSGKIELFRNPIIWSGFRQITGDSLIAYTNPVAQIMDSIEVRGNAFAVSKTDSLSVSEFHQLKSKNMTGIFTNENLDWVQGSGNAQSLLYVADDEDKDPNNKWFAINRSDCGIIEADLEEREVNVISCRIQARSKAYPLSKIPEEDRLLPNFKWFAEQRPHRWQDILIN